MTQLVLPGYFCVSSKASLYIYTHTRTRTHVCIDCIRKQMSSGSSSRDTEAVVETTRKRGYTVSREIYDILKWLYTVGAEIFRTVEGRSSSMILFTLVDTYIHDT